MKKYLLICLINLFLLLPFAFAATKVTKPTVLNKFLQFVLTAQEGSVVISGSNGTLNLENVAPNVTFFTNRPRRITSTMTTPFFLKRWIKPPPHDFKTSPPNAALIFSDEKNTQYTNIVILKDPEFDAEKNALRFNIQLLDGSWHGSGEFKQITLTMAEVTVCGLLGSWGNLPGEPQSDVNCHETLGKD